MLVNLNKAMWSLILSKVNVVIQHGYQLLYCLILDIIMYNPYY